MRRKAYSGLPASLTRQRGVALAIVVWFIAGMSLLVAGIVASARVDTHMAQLHVARAKAVAAGDGAIQLMMVDLMTAEDPAAGNGDLPAGNYLLGDIEVRVVLVPSAGLVDINAASADILAALFLLVGGLGEEDARMLAENVVQSRSAGAAQGVVKGAVKLDAIEDLLRVPGASRSLLDAVRDFIVVGESGRAAVDWSLAPDAVLDVLAVLNEAQADAVRARRDGRQAGAIANAYRADAMVHYGDRVWLRRRWISIERSASATLPWRVVRTEPPRVLMEDSYLLGRSVDA